jgi:hypothetical protein
MRQQGMPWGEEVPITDEVVRKYTSENQGPLTCGMVAELAIKQKWGVANKVEGCLVRELADGWIVAINGHDYVIDCEPEGTMGWKVEPYHMVFWRNGWMAVDLRPFVEAGVTQEKGVIVGHCEPELRRVLERLLA